eukprot:s3193_g5.t1
MRVAYTTRHEQKTFLEGIPTVLWDKDPGNAFFMTTFGRHVQTVEVTLSCGRGRRAYHVWDCLNFNVVFRDPPPTLIVNAVLQAKEQEVNWLFYLTKQNLSFLSQFFP